MVETGRYVKQYNNGRFSCGPIAILNALKFQRRRNATRKCLPRIARLLKMRNGICEIQHLNYAVQRMRLGRQMRRCALENIKQALLSGSGIISAIDYDRDGGQFAHAMFIGAIRVRGRQTTFYVANGHVNGQASGWFEVSEIERHYSRGSGRFWWSSAWIVPGDY